MSLTMNPTDIRWWFRAVTLLVVMVTFSGRCAITLVPKRMPWNQGREFRLN